MLGIHNFFLLDYTNVEVIYVNKKKQKLQSPMLDKTMPHQISSPDFKNTNIEPEEPFINEYGVVIGDSHYDSEHSPLNNWSTDTDPAIMSGDEWVHPTNDIGWNTRENRALAEGLKPRAYPFMHPTHDTSKD